MEKTFHFEMKPKTSAFDRLRLLFEEQVTVLTIAENLWVFSKEHYKEQMEQMNFHAAFVIDDGKYWKYDDGDEGLSPVEEHDWMDLNTPLLTAFRMILLQRRYFIKNEDGEPAYIVTRTDLDKIAMRIGLFGLISLFETHMKDLIRKHILNWEEAISENRLNQAKSLYDWKKARKEEIDLVQCLQFGDLGTVFSKQQRFKVFFPDYSRDRWVDMLNALGRLRDALAHSQAHLGFSWEEIDEMIIFIRGIIDREEINF
ncbi:hypothetical protein [Mongoliitalea lutea]|uniref:Swt1-like HEPN domain-containing protein n=1 Tax=Mongoliitalea lutea TaxID=849756 RepID=A0A8J3CWL8_9BACT|nr:hypothetical protein [Mongoliitalea lutea]GHB30081.1 hypothetical protein GCM10008106_08690 [Mongoliitalea lutea]